jgi:hypothetical protein
VGSPLRGWLECCIARREARVRISLSSLYIAFDGTLPSAVSQPLTEMSAQNLRSCRRLRLITSLPSVSRWGRVSTFHNPMGLHGLLQR